MSELKPEDKKLHQAINKAMEDDAFYDTILEVAQAKQIKQLQAENKWLKEELRLARGELVVDKDTGKLVAGYKLTSSEGR